MLKFAGQILIGAVVSLLGVQILSLPIFGLVVGSPLASVTATTFIIVLLMNAVNFIDGLDGLAAGIICIGSIAFFFYSYALSRTFLSYASLVTVLTVAIIGICIGFLGHNFAPASIFMGDAGSMQLGFLVSCASIMITGRIDPLSQPIPTLPAYMPIILPILIFMLPALDMFLAVVRRLKNKKSPFSPDRLHLHHRILNIIHSKPLAVVVLYLWAMLVAFSSLLTLFYPIQVVLIGFFGGVVVLGLFTFKIQSVINFAKLKIGKRAK
jgi:UDP-GlcNAc:undecaprenyl-phosphate GlcNAc-1-phosphate transferase